MIKELLSVALPHVKAVTIILKGDEENCTLAVICDPKDSGPKVKPINISGPAAEVEEAFEGAIQKIFVENGKLFTNVDDVVEDLKNPPKEEKKSTPSTSKSSTKKPEPKKEEPKAPELTKGQKAAVTRVEEMKGKAEKTDDVDMVNYLEKQAVDLYTKEKFDENAITAIKGDFDIIRKKLDSGEEGPDQEQETEPEEGLFAGKEQEEKQPETKAKADKKAPAKKEEPKKPEPEKEKEPEDGDEPVIF